MSLSTRSCTLAAAALFTCLHCGGRVDLNDPIPTPPSAGTGAGSGTTGSMSSGSSTGSSGSSGSVGTGSSGSSVAVGTSSGSTGGTGSTSTGGAGGSSGGTNGLTDVWIAFDSSGFDFNRDIYAVRPDGSDMRRLTTETSTDQEPAFSSDGRWLAFVSDRGGNGTQLYVMDLESRQVTRVTQRAAGARKPAFSPDSMRIAFRSGLSIYSIAFSGSDERVVATAPWDSTFGGPAYTADGRWIVYDNYNTVHAVHPDGTGDYVIVPPTTTMQSFPTVSPDVQSVALQVNCGEGFDSAGIWVVPMSGVEQWACATGRRLSSAGTMPASRHPAWGPASAVAWDTGKGDGDIVVWKDGMVTSVTTGSNDDRNPAWSPGGAQMPNL